MGKITKSRIVIPVLGLIWSWGNVTLAQQKLPNACQIHAVAIAPNPQKLSIRIAANSSSAIVGKLTPDAEVKVLASQSNWLLVEPIAATRQKQSSPARGWVDASSLGFTIERRTPLYAYPNTTSPRLGQLRSNTEVTLLACRERWAQVKHGQKQGWMEVGSRE